MGRGAADPRDDLGLARLELDRGRDSAPWCERGTLLVDDPGREAAYNCAKKRGLKMGLNEFSGYVGVALTGMTLGRSLDKGAKQTRAIR